MQRATNVIRRRPLLAGIRAGGSTRAAFPEAEASSGREHELERCRHRSVR